MHFSRYSACAIHLTLSLLVFSTLVFTMYFFWFPGDLFFLDGGVEGLKLVAMVDLVLGPLLTLVVFKPGKKSLKFDMTTIAVFQIVALGYGFFTTYHQQTLAVVYAEKKFNTLSRVGHIESNKDLTERELIPTSVKQYGDAYPYTIYTVQPTGASFGKFMADLLNGFPEAHERSDKYLILADNYEAMRKDRLDQEELEKNGTWAVVNAKLTKSKRSLDNVDLYRFKARYGRGVAVFDPQKMRIVDYIKLEPSDYLAEVEVAPEENPQASAE